VVIGDQGSMILIIQIQNISFHYYEFVKPVEEIIKKCNRKFVSLHYKELTSKLLKQASKIIICGTSLIDNSFLNDEEEFKWIQSYDNPLLGICGGMQILGSIFDEKIVKGQEIGLTQITYINEFLGQNGTKEVYELHNFYVQTKYFDTCALSDRYVQAIKHPQKLIYGVLFHPEVRNQEIIQYFIKNV
jgi:GMP synthase (glutamine-hydrolysing)